MISLRLGRLVLSCALILASDLASADPLTAVDASTAVPAYTTADLVARIDRFRDQGHFPAMNDIAPADYEREDPTAPLPRWLHLEFDRVQLRLFGRTDVFELVSCAKACGGMQASAGLSQRKIFFAREMLKELEAKARRPRELEVMAAFILGHELAHYVHERLIEIGGTRRSPFGHISCAGRDSPPDESAGPAAMRSFTRQVALAHSEVDALAAAALKDLGYPVESILRAVDEVLAPILPDAPNTSPEWLEMLADARFTNEARRVSVRRALK